MTGSGAGLAQWAVVDEGWGRRAAPRERASFDVVTSFRGIWGRT
jgi:hypothetical protein